MKSFLLSLPGRLAWRVRFEWMAHRWAHLQARGANVTVRTKHGLLTLSPRDNCLSRELFIHGEFQHDLTLRALSFLREKGFIPPKGEGCILDIGANNGVISIGMLLEGQFRSAIGIEPDPLNFDLLERNIAGNGLDARYLPLQLAVSDRCGEVGFEFDSWNLGNHRVRLGGGGERLESSSLKVQAETLDSVVAKLPKQESIVLAWMDIQGHEGYAFEGGRGLFSTGLPTVAEIWPQSINESGMELDRFCEIVRSIWSEFWVWRRGSHFISYPTKDLSKFLEELGETGQDDVIFTGRSS